jgi:F-type H+-transporting ATPase subunit a
MLGKIGPLLSLSIRMFGNALASYILMWLVYWGTGMLSDAIFVPLLNIEGMNIFGSIIAGVLHCYFDAFGAFIQMTIFTTLTMLLIATEIPAPVNVDMDKLNKKRQRKAERKALKKAKTA